MRAETGAEQDAQTAARQIVDDMKAAIIGGEHWYPALLEAIRNWPLPTEEVSGREYRYLVGGQAFDWLLLAERLSSEIADVVPADELSDLLFNETAPEEMTELEFQSLLGAKYKAHLNFVYGVRVEAALQMAVTEEIRKEHHGSRIWARNGHIDDEMYQRIYGKGMEELLAICREEGVLPAGEKVSLAELNEWRHWLFHYRVKNCDQEKVASDTRKGLAVLQRLELSARRRPAAGVELD